MVLQPFDIGERQFRFWEWLWPNLPISFGSSLPIGFASRMALLPIRNRALTLIPIGNLLLTLLPGAELFHPASVSSQWI